MWTKEKYTERIMAYQDTVQNGIKGLNTLGLAAACCGICLEIFILLVDWRFDPNKNINGE